MEMAETLRAARPPSEDPIVLIIRAAAGLEMSA
jgi:hypothetical protein